jgi:hypothetical protein
LRRRLSLLTLAFSVTLFVSALLLFLVQPLVGKMILPLLGGSPAVWNTCMVFFQALLLAGYAYAHASTAWLGVRKQTIVHLGLLFLPLVVLPIAVNPSLTPDGDVNPVSGVLIMLGAAVGLPFFVVSATAPLLQKWFAATGQDGARDPYFLYAASNFGSMLALLLYPIVIEPHWKLADQSHAWQIGYGILVAMMAGCAGLVWLAPRQPELSEEGGNAEPESAKEVSWRRRLHWVALAFVPSSWLLGVTTYLTTDIAPIPLLWVGLLAVYLLSFILVFGKTPAGLHKMLTQALPILVLLLLFMMVSNSRINILAALALHTIGLFAAAMVCHGELALDRPSTKHLTEFYLWMSFGGVLGGMFNALLAPVVFSNLLEYQIAMAAACFLLPAISKNGLAKDSRLNLFDLALPAAIILFAYEMQDFRNSRAVLDKLSNYFGYDDKNYLLNWVNEFLFRIADALNVPSEHRLRLQAVLAAGLPILMCYFLVKRPVRLGLAVSGVIAVFALASAANRDQVLQVRSFFGVLTVRHSQSEKGTFMQLVHGTTVHGLQFHDPDKQDPARRREALMYYHRTGPIGQVFQSFSGSKAKRNVAVIGLGAGTLASYGEAGQQFTFYEIDKLIKDIAEDPRYFTYLSDARDRGVEVKTVLGDARLQMQRMNLEPEKRYDLIVVDAFSSDAIPVHLITKQALDIYLDKLADGGLLAFHISNVYLDLEPVVANLAEAASLKAILRRDDDQSFPGKSASIWVVLARTDADLATIRNKDWQSPQPSPAIGVWTDDYSNLLSVFMRR